MRDFVSFQQTVWDFYHERGRHDLPWRLPDINQQFDAYKIMISEIMLQQTQVPRVIPKFQAFTARFPDVQTLAAAALGEVLTAWSGLGYNRRAKFLWQAAQTIVQNHSAQLPNDRDQLATLPGIGPNTAGAIVVYAFDQPVVFIETNIRTVFIHHFFGDEQHVSDKAIAELVQAALPEAQIRQWYWALMDYGTHLKQTVGNVSRQSKTFVKQSKFAGSRRQVRGAVLKLLSQSSNQTERLESKISDKRLGAVLEELIAEGLVVKTERGHRLP